MLWYSDTTYLVLDWLCVFDVVSCPSSITKHIYIYTRRFSAVVSSFAPLFRIDIYICKTLEEGIKSRTINTRRRSLL